MKNESRITYLAHLDQYLGTNDPTEEQYDALFVGGLPEALIDAALDKELYENFNSKLNKRVSANFHVIFSEAIKF